MERVAVNAEGLGPGVCLISVRLERSAFTPFNICWGRPSDYGFVPSATTSILNNSQLIAWRPPYWDVLTVSNVSVLSAPFSYPLLSPRLI